MAFNIPSHWKLNKDGTYDVKGNVKFRNKDLVGWKFPVRLGKVGGDFDCQGCTGLKSLEGIEHIKVVGRISTYHPTWNHTFLGVFYTGCRAYFHW